MASAPSSPLRMSGTDAFTRARELSSGMALARLVAAKSSAASRRVTARP